ARRLRKKRRELGGDQRRELLAQRVVGLRDRPHFRADIALEDDGHDLAKVDAEILDLRAVRHRNLGGDAYERLLQRQALRPEGDELRDRQPGEIAHLVGPLDARKHILGPEDRRERSQIARDPRFDPWIPSIEASLWRFCDYRHADYYLNPANSLTYV